MHLLDKELLEAIRAGRPDLLNKALAAIDALREGAAPGWAAKAKRVATLSLLPLGPDGSFEYGHTPLILAAEAGVLANVEALIPRGSLARQNHFGVDAVAMAAWRGRADCLQALPAAGASPNVSSHCSKYVRATEGWTALAFAASEGRSICCRLLLAAGADPHASGGQALLLAARLANPGCIQELLRAGASAHIADDHGKTPLMLAAERGSLQCVAALIPSSNLAARCPAGNDAIGLARANGREDARALLAKAQAIVDDPQALDILCQGILPPLSTQPAAPVSPPLWRLRSLAARSRDALGIDAEPDRPRSATEAPLA